MSKTPSLLLVIDASVARSAGETVHPVSSACRNYLMAVRDICHRVAETDEIKKEWDRHASRFARKWRVAMAARQKPFQPVTPVSTGLDVKTFPGPQRAAVEKDLHLLEAALGADRIIVTLDDALQRALDDGNSGARLRDRVLWHNPKTQDASSLHRP